MLNVKTNFTFILIFLFVLKISGQIKPTNHYDRIGFGTPVFNDGIAVVIKDGKYGYINEAGEEIISCKYECALNFSEGLAAVKENNKWGFINKKGNYVISNIYDPETADFFSERDVFFSKGYARVVLDNKAIFIDKKGVKIKDCPYDRIEPFYSGLAAVRLNSKWGFIDSNLIKTIPCIYDGTLMFPVCCIRDYGNVAPKFNNDTLCVVAGEYQSYYTIINKNGQQIISWSTCIIGIPNNEEYLSRICINNKFGFINRYGIIIIPAIYDDVSWDSEFRDVCLFTDKLMAVKYRSKYGYINLSGEEIIPFIYDKAEYFSDGKAKVILNGIEFYIDEKGNRIP